MLFFTTFFTALFSPFFFPAVAMVVVIVIVDGTWRADISGRLVMLLDAMHEWPVYGRIVAPVPFCFSACSIS